MSATCTDEDPLWTGRQIYSQSRRKLTACDLVPTRAIVHLQPIGLSYLTHDVSGRSESSARAVREAGALHDAHSDNRSTTQGQAEWCDERIGYLAVHPQYDDGGELMDALIFCNRVLGFVNAPAIMQRLVRTLQTVTIDVRDYQLKRDYLYDMLTSIGYRVRKPEGAFYMFPESPVADELELVAALQRHGVLVVPGRGFGMPGYFRISYCVAQSELEGAAPGFRAAFEELQRA